METQCLLMRKLLPNSSQRYIALLQVRYRLAVCLARTKFLDGNATVALPVVAQAAFNSTENQYKPLCLQDTRTEVLQEIRTWACSNDSRYIFWLNRLAGTGKSTIARTIALEAYDKGYLGASFFFTRGGGDLARAGKFFPTIAMQLATQMPSLKKDISTSLSKHQDITSISLVDQWNHLIAQPLINLESGLRQERLLPVIDTLDECDGDNNVRAILQPLSEIQRITTVQLCVFIISRPETPIRLGGW
jgi:NACHT domain